MILNNYLPYTPEVKVFNKLGLFKVIDSLKKEIYWSFSDSTLPKKEFKNTLDPNFKLFSQLRKDIVTDLKDIKHKLRIQKYTFD